MNARESIGKESPQHAREEGFNGAELSESVLGREWSKPEEDMAWSNL
jgi:hypothetical protein